jgi:hypothetical protein
MPRGLAERSPRKLRRPRSDRGRSPTPHIDVRAYLVSRGYVKNRREAAEALESGKVSINRKTYAYPHFPKHLLDYDDCGRPRIMVDNVPDPRPCQ